jgi:hypothetical protein
MLRHWEDALLLRPVERLYEPVAVVLRHAQTAEPAVTIVTDAAGLCRLAIHRAGEDIDECAA